ncbi:AraC family transcriptional regulator [Pricia sp. S334]|uniref:AraC family transcriptional regulator n=1 Tax=Pricia mediterranea TaxID=3076079 RepID=A0ABU3L1H8_9FLAO|nr:AraC family transcriptional regulator [Pricia sp. S334]MDT7827572.1 AraC family transcriptional regulator [Pricia sp. S334]
MNIYLKYDLQCLRSAVIKEQLEKLDVAYTLSGSGQLKLEEDISSEQLLQLKSALGEYGIEILDGHRTILVQRIKDAITEMVYDDRAVRYKLSTYLSEKLNYSYAHLSNVFPEMTHVSIESFVILKKIDYAKNLMVDENLTLTEVAHKLNYSSLAHFSSQFKKVTGMTPTAFLKVIEKRNLKGTY